MTKNKPAPKVIVIPAKEESAQELEKKKNLRVAAYCRVSTNSEEQLNSYENQKAYYTEKIMTNPDWTMVDVFADEGKTGTSACKRKDFLRMIRQCRQGKIDMILGVVFVLESCIPCKLLPGSLSRKDRPLRLSPLALHCTPDSFALRIRIFLPFRTAAPTLARWTDELPAARRRAEC